MKDADWLENPGHCPERAKGKRIAVRLANGTEPDISPVTTVTPAGWAADGKNRVRWSITGHPFDIAQYRII